MRNLGFSCQEAQGTGLFFSRLFAALKRQQAKDKLTRGLLAAENKTKHVTEWDKEKPRLSLCTYNLEGCFSRKKEVYEPSDALLLAKLRQFGSLHKE